MANALHYAPALASGPGPGAARNANTNTNTKVAIPRQRLQRPQRSARARPQVARACEGCRAHKIRCSGHKPLCNRCQSSGRECIYVLPRKDRLKIMTERCVRLARHLRTLMHAASEEDATEISELLETVEKDSSDQVHTPSTTDVDDEDFQESRAPLDDDVIDPQRHLDDNLDENNQSQATGSVGNYSEVQWRCTSFPHVEPAVVGGAGFRHLYAEHAMSFFPTAMEGGHSLHQVDFSATPLAYDFGIAMPLP